MARMGIRDSLMDMRPGGFWVIKVAILLQVLFVPWVPTRRNVTLGYRPIWSPPDERYLPVVDMPQLLLSLGITLFGAIMWHIVTRGSLSKSAKG